MFYVLLGFLLVFSMLDRAQTLVPLQSKEGTLARKMTEALGLHSSVRLWPTVAKQRVNID